MTARSRTANRRLHRASENRHIFCILLESVAIKTMSGRQTFRVTGDTKYFGPDGEACANGIQDERLATGNEVRIVTGLGGKTAKEVHLSSGKTAGKGKDRAR